MAPDLVLLSRIAFRDRPIAGPRLCGLLALLAGDLRTGCGVARLVEGLWPDERPAHPAKAVQILVSRVRSQLGADVIARTPTGYRLTLTENQVDSAAVLVRAAAAARCAREGDHVAALGHAEAGLALWEGARPGGDGDGDGPVAALRAERWAVHRALERARALALARTGRAAEAVPALAGVLTAVSAPGGFLTAGSAPGGFPTAGSAPGGFPTAGSAPGGFPTAGLAPGGFPTAGAAPVVASGSAPAGDEEVLLELLRCEAATAGPAAALARYENHRRRLRDELGADPGEALRAEHRRLLRGVTPAVRHGVAHEPNALLGRDADLAAVEALLRTSRVTSIVGPGGLGKTRLAHAVARRAEARTVVVVPLAGLAADDEVAREVTAVLGAHRAALHDGPALLVLDNCEHVVAGVAALVRDLVAATAELRVLTTGRTPLGLSSESVHLLPELSPATSAAVFVQRARAARPGADLPPAAVAEVCRHLDGLPLAVELAAARVRIMSVTELARRLDDRFGVLRGAARDTPERHRTLHAVVDWSWHLLEPAGRRLMRAMSVFPDGFPAAAAPAEAVLEHLVDHSLLKVTDTPSGTRLRMLETVREFSAARRAEAGETEAATAAFLDWARRFGMAHHDGLLGADPYGPVAAVRAERENLAHALRLALVRGDAPTVAAVAAVLAGIWFLESNHARLGALIEQTAWVLSHYRPEPDMVEVTRTALTMTAGHAFATDGPRPGRAMVALRRLGPATPDSMIRALGRAMAAPEVGDATAPLPASDAGDGAAPLLAPDTRDGAAPLLAAAAGMLDSYRREGAGDLDAALTAARRALGILVEHDLPWPRALAHCRVAELRLQRDGGEEARDHLAAALPVLERLGAGVDAAGCRTMLVLASLRVGDTAGAERWWDSLSRTPLDEEESRAIGRHPGYGLAVRAEMLAGRGEVEAALGLWRRVADQARDDRLAADPWSVEARAVAVVAHARHGRIDPIAEVADALPGLLTELLTHPAAHPPPHRVEQAMCGTLLLAVGLVDLARGDPAGGRLVALARRFRFQRTFPVTTYAARAVPGDEEAYAALDAARLRAAALELLAQRS